MIHPQYLNHLGQISEKTILAKKKISICMFCYSISCIAYVAPCKTYFAQKLFPTEMSEILFLSSLDGKFISIGYIISV